MRRTVACVSALAIGIAIAGCSAKRWAVADIDPVSGFSLGSARPPKLASRPTGEELWSATTHFYNSFATAAFSAQTDSNGPRSEFRMKSPNKWLHVTSWANGDYIVSARNGDSCFLYFGKNGTYIPWLGASANGLLIGETQLFARGDKKSGTSVRLLSDSRVNGQPVWVLEVKNPTVHRAGATSPGWVSKVYIGKSDLLVRRIERTAREGPMDHGRNVTEVIVFRGFVVNPAIPDQTFPKSPPKGSKRAPNSEWVREVTP